MISAQEKELLCIIEDSGELSDLEFLKVSTGVEIEELKPILEKLEKEEFISIIKKHDRFYGEDFWMVSVTDKFKESLKDD